MKKAQNILIVLIIILIIAIISCTVVIVKTVNKNNKATEEITKEEDKKTPIPTTTPEPAPTITLNQFGQSLMQNISYMTIENCLGGSSCYDSCSVTTPVKIEDTTVISEITAQIQVGTQIEKIPSTGAPMEFCGGIVLNFYYSDGTVSRIWFATRNHLIYTMHSANQGISKNTEYYYYDTEDLYKYLENKYEVLKSS